jgi:hypothetical protein
MEVEAGVSELRSASPAEIMDDLFDRYDLSSLLALQQAIGRAACEELVKELNYTAEFMPNRDDFYEGFTAASLRVDPTDVYFDGPVPSAVLDFKS